mgnify:CR=1 FL=1
MRTMNGERVGIIAVAAAITIIGTFASVATGAAASASASPPEDIDRSTSTSPARRNERKGRRNGNAVRKRTR